MIITVVDAINKALDFALTSNSKVVLLGEDIGKNGGVFRVTNQLQVKHPDKVLDTPLAENMLIGAAVGMSAMGLIPIVEIQFMGFLYAGLDQLISHAGKMRFRTQGRLSCPLVIRTPYGCGIHAPEHHSESTEAILAQIPGIKVVVPSSPATAYGLLLGAIQDPDPVIFLEPTRVYRLFKQQVVDNGQALPLDLAYVVQAGRDVTIVSWGAMLQEVLAAAQELAELGISAEIIDLAVIKPIDYNTIFGSVTKTGRCVIVHEAPLTCGVGAEIAARLADSCLTSLLAPIKRVTGFDIPVPPYRLEREYMPSIVRIKAAVNQVLQY